MKWRNCYEAPKDGKISYTAGRFFHRGKWEYVGVRFYPDVSLWVFSGLPYESTAHLKCQWLDQGDEE